MVFGSVGHIHAPTGMLKKKFVLRQLKHLSEAATCYRSQRESSRIVDEMPPFLVRLNSSDYHCKTKCSRYFAHNVSTCQHFFSLTASLVTGTQDLSISKNVQNGLQIIFHFRSKIRSRLSRSLQLKQSTLNCSTCLDVFNQVWCVDIASNLLVIARLCASQKRF